MTQTKTISVLLVDDEVLARERLKRLLQDERDYHICGEAENGEQAISRISELRPDLAILDIRMPGIDGLQVAEHICTMTPAPAIIFCTAYDEYAIKAFQYQAIAYLLKPIRKEDLLSALKSAGKLSQLQIKQLQAQTDSNEQSPTFLARTWQGMEVIHMEDIFYFRADHKYVTLVHKGGETLTDQSLKQIEDEYPDQLLRTHRNTIVNRFHIKSMQRNSAGHYLLNLSEQHQVQVSRRMVSEVKEALNKL